jgi:hypothetical protein
MARLAEKMGSPQSSMARDMQAKLQLSPHGLAASGLAADDPRRQRLDGEIEGYELVLALACDDSLDDDAFGQNLAKTILAAWPPDYLDYYQRFLAFFEEMPCPDDIGPRMEYDEWCEYVDQLHALAARCEQAGRRPESNKKYRRMLIKLLRVPGERAPMVEWRS